MPFRRTHYREHPPADVALRSTSTDHPHDLLETIPHTFACRVCGLIGTLGEWRELYRITGCRFSSHT